MLGNGTFGSDRLGSDTFGSDAPGGEALGAPEPGGGEPGATCPATPVSADPAAPTTPTAAASGAPLATPPAWDAADEAAVVVDPPARELAVPGPPGGDFVPLVAPWPCATLAAPPAEPDRPAATPAAAEPAGGTLASAPPWVPAPGVPERPPRLVLAAEWLPVACLAGPLELAVISPPPVPAIASTAAAAAIRPAPSDGASVSTSREAL